MSPTACVYSADDELDTTGMYGSAIDFVREQGSFPATSQLVYLYAPDADAWESWCGFGFVDDDGMDQVCAVTETATEGPGHLTSEEVSEIGSALRGAEVQQIDDVDSVFVQAEGGLYPEIMNDAGLLVFGSPAVVGASVYLPVETLGEGWLLKGTVDDGVWTFDVVASWIA